MVDADITITNHERKNMAESLFTVDQAKMLDRIAIEELSIPGISLMKRAGICVFETLLQAWPEILSVSGEMAQQRAQQRVQQSITVFCGAGNNAGDGYIVAGLAAQKKISVSVVYLSDPKHLSGDAEKAFNFARDAGVEVMAFNSQCQIPQGVIVDALFGIGLARPIEGEYLSAIQMINAASAPVIAVDVPSGLSADSGAILGDCVIADITATFIGRKRGLLTGDAPSVVGEIVFDTLIDEPNYSLLCAKVLSRETTSFKTISFAGSILKLPARQTSAHKGHFGHVLVVGGDNGMGGAVMMAAEAAARVGAGLISVATRTQHVAPLLARRPELMVHPVESSDDILPLLGKASVIVIGPGLGRSEWSKQLLKMAMMSELPMVVDADGLNLIAEQLTELSKKNSIQRDNWVLTPHPGEAARLLGVDVKDIARDRFQAVTDLQKDLGGAVVLKGAGSLVASSSADIAEDQSELSIGVNTTGNPGMATGGMGDVLSGIIGGLMAQKLSPKDAAELGVALHGLAADRAAEVNGQRGLLATDLFPHIRRLVNAER